MLNRDIRLFEHRQNHKICEKNILNVKVLLMHFIVNLLIDCLLAQFKLRGNRISEFIDYDSSGLKEI